MAWYYVQDRKPECPRENGSKGRARLLDHRVLIARTDGENVEEGVVPFGRDGTFGYSWPGPTKLKLIGKQEAFTVQLLYADSITFQSHLLAFVAVIVTGLTGASLLKRPKVCSSPLDSLRALGYQAPHGYDRKVKEIAGRLGLRAASSESEET